MTKLVISREILERSQKKGSFFNTKEAKLIISSHHSGKVKVVLLAESMLTVVPSYASFVGIGYVKYLLV